MLDDIKSAIEEKRKTIKFSLTHYIKAFFRTFTFLWGEEEVDFKIKKILAIMFTILACLFGSFWTAKNYLIFRTGVFVMPQYSAVLGGLLIYGALSVRNYMPRPNSFQNILFVIADVYLLSIISMHILGRGGFERNIVIVIFFGLIVLLWLGMKELLGFFLIGIFMVIIYKIFAMEQHLSWRAFPFLLSAFMGISFQSENFFDDFQHISRSFLKTSFLEREFMPERLEIPETEMTIVANPTSRNEQLDT